MENVDRKLREETAGEARIMDWGKVSSKNRELLEEEKHAQV